jgi:hypothetical protein
MVALHFDATAVGPGWEPTPGWLDARAAGIIGEAEALVWSMTERFVSREQCNAAADVVLGLTPPGVCPWAPWLDLPLPSGGPLDAVRRAEAEICGRASVAAQLAELPNVLPPEQALLWAEAHLAEARRVQRAVGGAIRGREQQEAAQASWQPWVARYQALRGAGWSPRMARSAVKAAMVQDGTTLPTTGEFPSDKVLRKRLRG